MNADEGDALVRMDGGESNDTLIYYLSAGQVYFDAVVLLLVLPPFLDHFE